MDTTDSSSFHMYYRMQGTTGSPSPRDHIIKDGEALCEYGVSVPCVESLKPIGEVSKSEWAVQLSKYSNLCGECSKGAEYYNLIPDDLPEESPEFHCPICDEPVRTVSFIGETVSILHKARGSSFPPSSDTHNIPRERYDMWRVNPEEPYSYSKLKSFIENYHRVFRPQEYRQAKREEYYQEDD